MPDITMCCNLDCKIKATCFRYTAPPSMWQSYSKFDGPSKDAPCPDFLQDLRQSLKKIEHTSESE